MKIRVESDSNGQVNKDIRSNLRLLNSELFLKENGVLVFEVIELYNDIQIEDEDRSPWKVSLHICVKSICELLFMLLYLVFIERIRSYPDWKRFNTRTGEK